MDRRIIQFPHLDALVLALRSGGSNGRRTDRALNYSLPMDAGLLWADYEVRLLVDRAFAEIADHVETKRPSAQPPDRNDFRNELHRVLDTPILPQDLDTNQIGRDIISRLAGNVKNKLIIHRLRGSMVPYHGGWGTCELSENAWLVGPPRSLDVLINWLQSLGLFREAILKKLEVIGDSSPFLQEPLAICKIDYESPVPPTWLRRYVLPLFALHLIDRVCRDSEKRDIPYEATLLEFLRNRRLPLSVALKGASERACSRPQHSPPEENVSQYVLDLDDGSITPSRWHPGLYAPPLPLLPICIHHRVLAQSMEAAPWIAEPIGGESFRRGNGNSLLVVCPVGRASGSRR